MPQREEILQQALALPAEDRAYVATALERSLDEEGLASEKLLSELRRRSAAYHSGTSVARPAAEVLAELRTRQNGGNMR